MPRKMLGYRLFVFFILVSVCSANCQNSNYLDYHRNVSEAHYYFYNNDLKTAKMYFEQGMQQVDVCFEKDLLLYAVCLWENGDKSQAVEILDTNLYAFVGLNPTHYFGDMSDSLKIAVLARNTEFVNLKVDKDKKSRLYQLVDSLYLADRDIRLRMNAYLRSGVVDNQVKGIFEDSIVKLRDETFVILDSVFIEHGYLGGINYNSRYQLSILMLHSSPRWVKRNKRFLQNELKKGHIQPYDYARLIDRKLYCEKGKDAYFKQWEHQSGEKKITEMEFFKRLNSIGLSPYFIFTDKIPGQGKFPKKSNFYTYFHLNKERFECNR